MKIKKLTILSFLAISLLSGCSKKENENINDQIVAINGTKKDLTAKKAERDASFVLQSVNNGQITIDLKQNSWDFVNYKNKAVLVVFFGTWCPPCKAEIPHLVNLRKKFNQDLEIIGVDVGKRGTGKRNSQQYMKTFIKEHNVTYPIAFDGDVGAMFASTAQLNPSGSIPFMILFDKHGVFQKDYIGMTPEEMLEQDIKNILKD